MMVQNQIIGISTFVQPYTMIAKGGTHYGIHWLDYGARQYMPDLAQFTSVDPLAEKYYHLSPYAYCANNPVRFIDENEIALLLEIEWN